MKTVAKTLAGIVATVSLATAEEKAAKPDATDAAVAVGEAAKIKFDGNRAGEEREFEIAPGVRMKFCWCPAGEFVMGSPKSEEGRDGRDEDQVKVTLTKGFWIAKTELSQAQWEGVMGSNPFDGVDFYGKPFPKSMKVAERPVVGVSWDDAQKFMAKINTNLGNADGGKMSLPTEAQYEYAARAGETGMYPGGKLDDVAWYAGNSQRTQPVGTKKPNAWGLHDMSGNVWEWVQDGYNPVLPGGTDPIAPESDLNRVIRGGCWLKEAADSRLATRSLRAKMASQCYSIGVRIVRSSLPVAAPAAAVINPEVTGPNVKKITYQAPDVEKSFEQTGPKSWTSGGIAYTEVQRDEWSVILHEAKSEDAQVQIDLFTRKVTYSGQGPKVVHPILSAAK